MKALFGPLFGRAGNQPGDTDRTARYDPEYVAYCIELEQTISSLEEYLHESDDPRTIAEETLKVVCRFYGGNWAGILDVDLELDIWTPLWWYNRDGKDRTKELFRDFEIAKSMPNWLDALSSGKPISILDAASVQSQYPEEYEIYQRLGVDSVIGVPFGPNPVGILAVRNPTRYTQYSSALRVLAYVIHRAMAQQKNMDSAKLAMSPDEIETDRDVSISFFGSMQISTSMGTLRERDFNSPKSSRVATFLMLNPKSAFSPAEIVAALWPSEEEKWDTLASYVRGYVHTFRKSYALLSSYPLIVSSANGYRINPELHIMTDLEQFDLLWEKAQQAATIPHRVELLKKAVALYKGPVFENACNEHWVSGIMSRYQLRYIGIVNELLATLDKAGDFTGVQQYATKAIELVPENVRAHYWLVHSMNHLGSLELARNQLRHAKERLTGDEFASLKRYILADETMPDSLLLGF